MTAAEITCGRCGEIWTGLGRAHCDGCHRTFTVASAFDVPPRQPGMPQAVALWAQVPKRTVGLPG